MTTALHVIASSRPAALPVEYDRALQALVACTRIDEARTWSDKADALAAWAKIYKSDQASVLAQRLKLHAYRRMGQLAEELRPHRRGASGAMYPGGKSLLLESGLTKGESAAARRLATLTPRQFDQVLAEPAAPTTIAHRLWNARPAWKQFSRASSLLKSMLEHQPAEQLADGICECGDRCIVEARDRTRSMIKLLTELERQLCARGGVK